MIQSINPLVGAELFEVMGHARGGQGMVTAFEILSKIFSHTGEYEVQAFPSFGVERTGAPIQGFLRISKTEILNRSNIYNPHLIVVFDESLLGQVPVFAGLHEGGTILLNTSNKPEMYQEKAAVVYTVPATRISIEKQLGSKSLPIVNSAMIGALLRILGGDIEVGKMIIKEEVPSKPDANAEAAEIAYNSLSEFVNPNPIVKQLATAPGPKSIIPQAPFWNDPMSLNKTGSWRMSIPIYVTRNAPCSHHCPAGTQVREFIQLAAEERFEEAYELIFKTNPFPSLCGRVCAGYCEQNCNRADYDGTVNIRTIESYIGDHGSKKEIVPNQLIFDEKIAVFGSGPDGLTTALRLRQAGYFVNVFEPASKAGGILRNGYLDDDLPDELLNHEIEKIVQEGLEISLNSNMQVTDLPADFGAIVCSENFLLENTSLIRKKGEISFLNGIPVFVSSEMNKVISFIETVEIGNKTAKAVNAFLRNEKLVAPAVIEEIDVVKSEEMRFHYYESAPQNKKRSYTFSEVMDSLNGTEIAAEAARCLHCGTCFNCGNCYNYCPDAVVHFDKKNRLRVDYEYCKGCGICYHECPSAAMKFDIIKKIKQ